MRKLFMALILAAGFIAVGMPAVSQAQPAPGYGSYRRPPPVLVRPRRPPPPYYHRHRRRPIRPVYPGRRPY